MTLLRNTKEALQTFADNTDSKPQKIQSVRAISTLFYYFGFLLKGDKS